MKLIECPECGGEGRLISISVMGGPHGPIEYWEDCEFCLGEGEVENEDDE